MGLEYGNFTSLGNGEFLFDGLNASGQHCVYSTNGTASGTQQILNTGSTAASFGGVTGQIVAVAAPAAVSQAETLVSQAATAADAATQSVQYATADRKKVILRL